jgi:hypothetical protein
MIHRRCLYRNAATGHIVRQYVPYVPDEALPEEIQEFGQFPLRLWMTFPVINAGFPNERIATPAELDNYINKMIHKSHPADKKRKDKKEQRPTDGKPVRSRSATKDSTRQETAKARDIHRRAARRHYNNLLDDIIRGILNDD